MLKLFFLYAAGVSPNSLLKTLPKYWIVEKPHAEAISSKLKKAYFISSTVRSSLTLVMYFFGEILNTD